MDWYVVPASVLSSSHPLPRHVSLEPCDQLLALITTQIATVTETEEDKTNVPDVNRKPGRRISKENAILRKFVRDQEGIAPQPPKLENIRYRVMRTLKKLLRRLAVNKSPGSRGLLQFQYNLGQGAYWYSKMQEYASSHHRTIYRFSELQNGPKVDQSRTTGTFGFSTYNNPYMDFVFSNYEIRVIYRLFVNLLFSDDRVQSLNQRFKVLCCQKTTHSEECVEKWSEFRKMMEEYLGAHVATVSEEIPELTPPLQLMHVESLPSQ